MTERTNQTINWGLSWEENWKISWEKASTFDTHARNYRKWYWKHPGEGRTGDFTTDYGVTKKMLATAFMEDHCPWCHRAYASMVHDRGRDTRIPRWWQSFHIHFGPDTDYKWIVLCQSCHAKEDARLRRIAKQKEFNFT
jgi:hypothetical protein